MSFQTSSSNSLDASASSRILKSSADLHTCTEAEQFPSDAAVSTGISQTPQGKGEGACTRHMQLAMGGVAIHHCKVSTFRALQVWEFTGALHIWQFKDRERPELVQLPEEVGYIVNASPRAVHH